MLSIALAQSIRFTNGSRKPEIYESIGDMVTLCFFAFKLSCNLNKHIKIVQTVSNDNIAKAWKAVFKLIPDNKVSIDLIENENIQLTNDLMWHKFLKKNTPYKDIQLLCFDFSAYAVKYRNYHDIFFPAWKYINNCTNIKIPREFYFKKEIDTPLKYITTNWAEYQKVGLSKLKIQKIEKEYLDRNFKVIPLKPLDIENLTTENILNNMNILSNSYTHFDTQPGFPELALCMLPTRKIKVYSEKPLPYSLYVIKTEGVSINIKEETY